MALAVGSVEDIGEPDVAVDDGLDGELLVVVDEYLPEGDYFCLLPVVLGELAVPDYFEEAGLVVLEDHHDGVGLVPAHDEVVEQRTDRPQLVVHPDLVNRPLEVVVPVAAERVRL